MATITLPEAAFRLKKFAFLIDNMVINVMSLSLARAQMIATTVFMLPQSLTSPVHPRLLTRRSERLAKSIRIDRPRAFGLRFYGALLAGGMLAPYAAIHENGGTINHPGSHAKPGGVLAWHARDGEAVFARSTKPHTIEMPARPFLKPSVKAVLPFMAFNLERGVREIRSESGL